MRLLHIVSVASVSLAALEACSSNPEQGDGGNDAAQNDVTQNDVAQQKDSATNDVQQSDASDGGCPSTWTATPDVGVPGLDVPDGGGGVILHGAASGTQNYMCEANDAGYSWTFTGPQANLDDCSSNLIAHHFASDAGPTAPEWQTLDNSYVIGKKIAAYTPDGGSGSVPWLLLQETSNGGSGVIAQTLYIQRLFTDGGVAPTSTCDQGTVGTTMQQPYTADYYFYGP